MFTGKYSKRLLSLLLTVLLTASLLTFSPVLPNQPAFAAGSASITKTGNTWTLENDVLKSVISFSSGNIDMTSFYNKEAAKEYLNGTGSKYLFKYTYDGSNLLANDGGWTLGTDTISDISVFSKTWGKQLVVNISRTSPKNVNVKLVFEIYNGRAGLRYYTYIKNNDSSNKKTVSASDVVALNFPNNAHTIYYSHTSISWASTTGALASGKINCINRYDTGDGWIVAPENNHGTSLQAGQDKGDTAHPFMNINAWSGINNVVVSTDTQAVQLVLFPNEEVEYFSVNLQVFKGDMWDGRMAAAEHFRQRFKYNDPTMQLSTNDWYWSSYGQGGNRTDSYYRNTVVPAAKAAGFDRIHIDEYWNTDPDGTTPKPSFTSDLPSLASFIESNGLITGYWHCLHGKDGAEGFYSGRDLADPATIDFKKSQTENTMIPSYRSKWQQIDLGETFKNDTATSYSSPSDSVYRKWLGFRNYANYISHKYPDMMVQETCEFDNIMGSRGSASMLGIPDNGVSGLFWGDSGTYPAAKDLFGYFGEYPAEGMLGFWDNGEWTGNVNQFYQFLTARHQSIYVDPGTWTAQAKDVCKKFNDWRKNTRIKSILNEIARPTYYGGSFDSLSDPYVWMFVNEAKNKAIVVGKSTTSIGSAVVNLRWLDDNKMYLVEDISLDDDGVFHYAFMAKKTGAQLKSPGFAINFSESQSSAKAYWIQEMGPTNPHVLYADDKINSYTENWDGSLLTVNVSGVANSTGTVIVYKDAYSAAETKTVSINSSGSGSVTFDNSAPPPPPVNLALGKTANASSIWDANYAASKANDGLMTTRWNSANGQFNNQWLEIDFGSATAFNKTVVKEHTGDGCGNRITGYTIQYYNGSSWVDAAAGTTVGPSKTDTFTSVTASKVRIYIASASAEPTIDEFQVYNEGGGSGEIKLSGTAFGTSPPWQSGQEYDKAFDGNTSTYFNNGTPSGGYTGIDLGAGSAKAVTKVRFYPLAGFESRMNGGKFQGSNTAPDSGYVDLYTIPSTPGSVWNEVNITDTTQYRYLRYVGPANSYSTVCEVEFYGTSSTGSANLALNKTANASSQWDSSYGASKANDGDSANTRWSAAGTDGVGSWLEIDFGSSTTFNKTITKQCLNRITRYKIQYWNGSSWVDAYTGGTMGTNPKTDAFTAVTGSKVRLYVTAVQTDSGFSCPTIWEFEVYNQ